MFTQKIIKIFHSIQEIGSFSILSILQFKQTNKQTKQYLQFLWLDLVNIKVSAKFYQNIANGLRFMGFYALRQETKKVVYCNMSGKNESVGRFFFFVLFCFCFFVFCCFFVFFVQPKQLKCTYMPLCFTSIHFDWLLVRTFCTFLRTKKKYSRWKRGWRGGGGGGAEGIRGLERVGPGYSKQNFFSFSFFFFSPNQSQTGGGQNLHKRTGDKIFTNCPGTKSYVWL